MSIVTAQPLMVSTPAPPLCARESERDKHAKIRAEGRIFGLCSCPSLLVVDKQSKAKQILLKGKQSKRGLTSCHGATVTKTLPDKPPHDDSDSRCNVGRRPGRLARIMQKKTKCTPLPCKVSASNGMCHVQQENATVTRRYNKHRITYRKDALASEHRQQMTYQTRLAANPDAHCKVDPTSLNPPGDPSNTRQKSPVMCFNKM